MRSDTLIDPNQLSRWPIVAYRGRPELNLATFLYGQTFKQVGQIDE